MAMVRAHGEVYSLLIACNQQTAHHGVHVNVPIQVVGLVKVTRGVSFRGP